MKVISIGRDSTQNICYDNEMVSRRHALLKIYSNGKIELISMGKNGTFVNGIMCKQNVAYPIKRKDVVSFAHVCELDWSLVPNPFRWLKISGIVLFVLVFLALVGWGFSILMEESYTQEQGLEPKSEQTEITIDVQPIAQPSVVDQDGSEDRKMPVIVRPRCGLKNDNVDRLFPTQPSVNEETPSSSLKKTNVEEVEKNEDIVIY